MSLRLPACFVEAFNTLDGQPFPNLFFAVTLTSYFIFGLRCVKRHDVDREFLNPVRLSHGSLILVIFICARYPVTGPPSASRAGGLHVTLMELQRPEKTECNTGGYGTTVK